MPRHFTDASTPGDTTSPQVDSLAIETGSRLPVGPGRFKTKGKPPTSCCLHLQPR
ncbi:hypothetical protein RISK_001270 [Rhodopirellula islandica]|uniref:Uncharacterized protein n=1 Tax=Rhodopirellula islandica TaxID=595434 RepID=A0A0J1BJG8_RHOIS|nr:hypothetical protein RISK_001270 [Rhodopirellula islandica]